jgi:medium-chain acyl-[acyl-carrier-protein] hydrolase
MDYMQKANSQPPWFNTYGLPQQGQARIFAFPYSGAGALMYYKWAKLLDDRAIDFVGLQLPARENRIKEPPIGDFSELLKAMVPAIIPLLDKPFVFFGHSFGALLAFELCRALRRQGLPLPVHLFVSAFRSPDQPNPARKLHALADADFIDGIRAYGGTAEEVLSNNGLMELFLPMLRADFRLHETYTYQEGQALACPITALTGSEDDFVGLKQMANWQRQTDAQFEQVTYEGKHFFLHDHIAAIMQRLKNALEPPSQQPA